MEEFRKTVAPGLTDMLALKYQSTRRHVEDSCPYVTLDVLVCLLMFNFRNWILHTRSVRQLLSCVPFTDLIQVVECGSACCPGMFYFRYSPSGPAAYPSSYAMGTGSVIH